MNQKAEALRQRTHRFFVRVVRLCEALPATQAARSISAQLIDSAGGTDSNYRAACLARSRRDFISKIGVAAEEADESAGWLRALDDLGLADASEVQALVREAEELTKILSASGRTAKRNLAAGATRGSPPRDGQ